MFRRIAPNSLLMLLLCVALAMQGSAGCNAAHANQPEMAVEHCENMAMSDNLDSKASMEHPSGGDISYACAKLCHPVAVRIEPVQPAIGVIHLNVPEPQRLDDLSGKSIRPATPPPRMS